MRALLALLLAGPAAAALPTVSLKVPGLTGVRMTPVQGATSVPGEAVLHVPVLADFLEQREDYPLRGITDGKTVILVPAALHPGARVFTAAATDGHVARLLHVNALQSARLMNLARGRDDAALFAELSARFDGTGPELRTVEIAGRARTAFDRPEAASTAARMIAEMLKDVGAPRAEWLPAGEAADGGVPKVARGTSMLKASWDKNADRLRVEYTNSAWDPQGVTFAFLTLATDGPALFDSVSADPRIPASAAQDALKSNQDRLVKEARFRVLEPDHVLIEDVEKKTLYSFRRVHGEVRFTRSSPQGELTHRFSPSRAPKPIAGRVVSGVEEALLDFRAKARRLMSGVSEKAFGTWEPFQAKGEAERLGRARARLDTDARSFDLLWSYEGPEGPVTGRITVERGEMIARRKTGDDSRDYRLRRVFVSKTEAAFEHEGGKVTIMAGPDGHTYLIDAGPAGTATLLLSGR